MFGLFKRKRAAPAAEVVAGATPLAGRDGHVGGIETIVVDGETLHFGFDYGSDLVLSPLIGDPAAMARFASRYMRQRDGSHDEAYWVAMIEDCEGGSGLCSDEAGRTFTGAGLAHLAGRLREAAATGVPQPGFGVPYHLRYLLAAAAGWPGGLDFEAGDVLAAAVAGDEPPEDAGSVADAARALQAHLAGLVDGAPGGWATTFARLKG